MAKFSLKILDKSGIILYEDSAETMANLVVTREYEPEDGIIIETSEQNIHVWLQVDDPLPLRRSRSSVQMNLMIKADDPSPFPALTQLEIYGTVVR